MPAAIEKGRLNREIWAVVIALTALLIAISLVSYNVNDRSFNTPSGAVDTHNWGGFLGAFLADLLLQGLGLSSYLVPVLLIAGAAQMFRASYEGVSLARASAYAVLLVSIGVLLSVIIDSDHWRHAFMLLGLLWGLIAAARGHRAHRRAFHAGGAASQSGESAALARPGGPA